MKAINLKRNSLSIKIHKGYIISFLFRFSPYFWLSGLYILDIFLIYILSISKISRNLFKDKFLLFYFVFFALQILSLALAPIFHDYATPKRVLAISHNIFVYSFLFAGYNLASRYDRYLHNALPVFLKYFVFLVIIGFVISFITKYPIRYEGLLGFLGSNKYTVVSFNRMGWTWLGTSPRSEVFGIYSNATAILLFLTYILCGIYTKLKPLMSIIVLICFFTLGSRTLIILSTIAVVIYHFRSRWMYIILILSIPLIFYFLYAFIPFLYNIRLGSNESRMFIYLTSLRLMFEINPVLGLGLKPVILEFSVYPLGSHSTLIGYYVKCGLLGGTLVLFGYLYSIHKATMYYMNVFVKSIFKFEHNQFFCISSFMLILIISLIEDFDAYEPIMLFSGMIIFYFKQSISNMSKLTSNL